MDDIVDRLRTEASVPKHRGTPLGFAAMDAANEIQRLQEVITDFIEAREALNKNEWCDDSGAFRSAYQDASRALESEARRG